MASDINNIRINDWFWIKFGNSFISFGYKGLPEDIHLTLSLNQKAEDYNIHIGSDQTNKPKIEIVRINKQILEKIGPYSLINLVNQFLKPLDIDTILNSADESTMFISIESLETGIHAKAIEGHIMEGFKPISKLKSKGRFRIEGKVESAFETILQNEHYMNSMMDNRIPFKDAVATQTKGGMLMYNQEAIAVIQIQSQWFEFRPETNPMALLASVVGEEWSKTISEHFVASLSRIKNATTFTDTKEWNTPIILVANPQFEKAIDDLQNTAT